MNSYYIDYDSVCGCWDVLDSYGVHVTSFEYEYEAASYCDHLNENDY